MHIPAGVTLLAAGASFSKCLDWTITLKLENKMFTDCFGQLGVAMKLLAFFSLASP